MMSNQKTISFFYDRIVLKNEQISMINYNQKSEKGGI